MFNVIDQDILHNLTFYKHKKTVRAFQIRRIEDLKNKIVVHPKNKAAGVLIVNEDWIKRYRPRFDGYCLIDDVGILSYMAEKEFESKYRQIY